MKYCIKTFKDAEMTCAVKAVIILHKLWDFFLFISRNSVHLKTDLE